MPYTKTNWIDHITDAQGNIIQQGTPISATNLKKLESGVANNAVLADNSSAMIREAIYSGITKLSAIDYTYMKTNPNKIKLTGGGVAFVNGFKVDISDGTIVTLSAPPTAGEREDLVFLEVWKSQATDTAGEVISSRIRIVAGVDFTTYSEGINHTSLVKAWGGNTADTTYTFTKSTTDVGLYTSGTGSSSDKTALKTADGYVYGIPLFRIKRRNSGGYSVSNPNGGKNYTTVNITRPTINVGYTAQITVNTNYNELNVGDYLATVGTSSKIMQVISLDGTNLATVKNVHTATLNAGSATYDLLSKRPDIMYSDIIDDRDIIDLRRMVSLTGYDYQYLVEDSLEKLQKGELQTKERKKMVKVYHGISKTSVDSNHVFYASFDGTIEAEIGGVLNPTGTISYVPMPTGLGFTASVDNSFNVINLNNQSFCWDITIRKSDFIARSPGNIITLGSATSCTRIRKSTAGDLHMYISADLGTTTLYTKTLAISAILGDFIKVRINYQNGNAECFVNGISLGAASELSLINDTYTTITVASNVAIADLAISNISRGATDPTLPADVIAGYARIDKAFNVQRKTHSDALTSQYTLAVVKGAGSGHTKGITVTQAVAEQWTSGDTIKVKGLAREIISGVIDSDTALARILKADATATITVDDVSKIIVGDELRLVDKMGTASSSLIVSSIDPTAKTITFSYSVAASFQDGYVVEATANTSSPIAKFMNAGTMTTVTGTWSGLGTNEATFTLGTNASLTNQDIQIEYSLNMVPGQGIPEVYIQTLAGEAKGKKLIPGIIAVTDDYVGKTAGDSLPMSAKWTKVSSLQIPSAFITEALTADYTNMAKLGDNNVYTVSTSVNGEIAQVLILIDVVKEIEERYGPIPSIDKVSWAKSNLAHLGVPVYAHGSGPNGDKCNVSLYRFDTTIWTNTVSNSNASPTYTGVGTSSPQYFIDSSGFAYVCVYTDASNGSVASSVTIDYVSIALQLKGITGYDMLVPENPRRDDGQANVLLVRKETKEIQCYFDSTNTDGIITYGDVIPYQGMGVAMTGIALSSPVALLTTDGTGAPRNSISSLIYTVPITTQLPMVGADYLLIGEVLSGLGAYNDFAQTRTRALPVHNNTTTSYRFPAAGVSIGVNTTTYPSSIRGQKNGQSRFYCQIPKQDLPTNTTKYVIIVANIFIREGELYLAVAVSAAGGKLIACDGGASGACDIFRLPNRPLLKGV